jgi:hypothetical protein
MQSNEKNKPDPGPLVLACLYRAAYNEQEPVFKYLNNQIFKYLILVTT